MKTPAFWAPGAGGFMPWLLSPLGWCYGVGTALRQRLNKSQPMPVPVICVGNLIAGGAGKTPVTMDIARRLIDGGVAVHIVTSGYGAAERGPHFVNADDPVERVGDEALLLTRAAPTWVASNRVAGCRAAIEGGAEAILFDDGFQDPAVARDLSLVVVDGGYGFGNGQMVPAGPLRESIAAGLGRADAVILIGDDSAGVRAEIADRLPIIVARKSIEPVADKMREGPVFAFAGIARPEAFFNDLVAAGVEVVGRRAFADHHRYTEAEMRDLAHAADEANALLVTTEKDAVRLDAAMREHVTVVPLHLRWDSSGAIDPILQRAVTRDG